MKLCFCLYLFNETKAVSEILESTLIWPLEATYEIWSQSARCAIRNFTQIPIAAAGLKGTEDCSGVLSFFDIGISRSTRTNPSIPRPS